MLVPLQLQQMHTVNRIADAERYSKFLDFNLIAAQQAAF